MHYASEVHLIRVVKRAIRYIKETIDFDVKFKNCQNSTCWDFLTMIRVVP